MYFYFTGGNENTIMNWFEEMYDLNYCLHILNAFLRWLFPILPLKFNHVFLTVQSLILAYLGELSAVLNRKRVSKVVLVSYFSKKDNPRHTLWACGGESSLPDMNSPSLFGTGTSWSQVIWARPGSTRPNPVGPNPAWPKRNEFVELSRSVHTPPPPD